MVTIERNKCFVSIFQSFKHSQDLVDYLIDNGNFERSTVEKIAKEAFDAESAEKIIDKFIITQMYNEITKHEKAIESLKKKILSRKIKRP